MQNSSVFSLGDAGVVAGVVPGNFSDNTFHHSLTRPHSGRRRQ